MRVIYEPKGPAREYSPLACNLYRGCRHGCRYCYVPGMPPFRFEKPDARAVFHGNSRPRENVLAKLTRDAEELAGDPREILFCFTCDPYEVGRDNALTRRALKICAAHGLRVQILTKGAGEAWQDFDLLKANGWKFGTTITFMSDARRAEWEPHAASLMSRVQTIGLAHDLGIETWVSLEPVISAEEAICVIEHLAPQVDFWKIGKINHRPVIEEAVDWRAFVRAVAERLPPEKYMLKDSLRPYASGRSMWGCYGRKT
jgi:DNA repair photolyase